MLLAWLKRRRRQRILARRTPGSWDDCLAEDVPFFARLEARDQQRLLDIARILMAEKSWYGSDDFELTDRIRLSIAAQAALLLLHLDHDYYRSVESIIVRPTTYTTSQQDGPLVNEVNVLGLASAGDIGTIVLAWDAAAGGAMNPDDGRNVVFHEFAHALDVADGLFDGTPTLGSREQFDQWVAVMTEHYEQLVSRTRAGRRSVIDAYGATEPAEFFAEATEAFFEKPDALKRKLPDLYDAMRDYYQQDPANG